MIETAGGEVVPIPVDESGMRVGDVPPAGVDVVVVTAAHQYPTGSVLPPERRAELVAWANATDGLIVEDDYDAEFRYDREAIGAIQGLAPDRVIYAGSASKVFAPGLRLGWLAAPSRIADALAVRKHIADSGSPALDQLALADFISRGELDRHLRRMRPIYRRRRDALLAALHRHLPDIRPVGASAGLHVLAWLPANLDEAAIVRAARADGIAIEGLATRLIRRPGPGGLIFGYGSISEDDMDRAVRRLAVAVERSRSRYARRMSETAAEPAIDHYPNGNVRFRGANLDGEMHGPWEFFRADGSLMRSGSFAHGRQVGTWRTFDRSGTVVKETRFPDKEA